jgi:hypothetical protein
MITRCENCGKDLSLFAEIHAVEGMLFCTEECAVAHQAAIITASAYDTATEWYKECAEIVTPRDIGLAYEEIWTIHEGDITVIFKSIYRDSDKNELLSTEITGFYFGTPNDKDTELFNGKLKAEY